MVKGSRMWERRYRGVRREEGGKVEDIGGY